MARGANKERILDAGLNLLYAKGYNATGIQDIADAAGVPKGSFYNYFKSKEDFAAEVIGYYTNQTVLFLERHLNQGNLSPLIRMRQMLEQWANTMFTQKQGCGCLVGNLTQEMGNHSDKIQLAAKEDFARLEGRFIACLQEAQEQGEIAPEQDMRKLGTFIYNGWQGALVRSKAEGNGDQLKAYVDYIFDVILPPFTTLGVS